MTTELEGHLLAFLDEQAKALNTLETKLSESENGLINELNALKGSSASFEKTMKSMIAHYDQRTLRLLDEVKTLKSEMETSEERTTALIGRLNNNVSSLISKIDSSSRL